MEERARETHRSEPVLYNHWEYVVMIPELSQELFRDIAVGIGAVKVKIRLDERRVRFHQQFRLMRMTGWG